MVELCTVISTYMRKCVSNSIVLSEYHDGQDTERDYEVQEVPSGRNGEAISASSGSPRGMFITYEKIFRIIFQCAGAYIPATRYQTRSTCVLLIKIFQQKLSRTIKVN